MLKIQILTPFRHQFRNKDIWLTAYEAYYLDIEKDGDKAELEYILSNQFPYRDFIYIEPSTVNQSIIDSVKAANGARPVQEFTEPTLKLGVEESLSEPELEPAVPTNAFAQDKRREELQQMRAKNVRFIAEQHGIEYTNKDEAIEAILTVEF